MTSQSTIYTLPLIAISATCRLPHSRLPPSLPPQIHEGVWVRSWDSSTIGIQEPPTDTPMPVLSHVGPGMCWADLTDVREGEAVPIR